MSGGLRNVYLTRTELGWGEFGDLASEVANGRAEETIQFGGLRNRTTEEAIVDRLVAVTGGTYVASIAEIEPAVTGMDPYVAFTPYDVIALPGPSGATQDSVVQAINAETDNHGHPLWTLEANGRVLNNARLDEAWLRRSLPGFVAGRTETANPATPASIIDSGEVQAKEWRASKSGALGTGDLESQTEKFGTTAHVMLFACTITTAASSGTTTVVLKRSGTTIATCSIAAGTNEDWVGIDASSGLINGSDSLQVEITATGTGAEGLVATARFI